MKARLPLLLLCSASLTQFACAIPHGSLARPVQPVAEGKSLVGGGMLVPFAGAGSASSGDEGVSFANTTNGFTFVPALNWDYGLGDAQLIGVEVSLLKNFADSGDDSLGVFVNPRFEYAIDGEARNIAITVDGNLGFFTDGTNSLPLFSPLIGIRWYVPVANGGLIVSQQLGTLGFFVGFPGSLAYDIAIGSVHIFPEFRWDPNAFFISDTSGLVAIFSGGLSFMVEL